MLPVGRRRSQKRNGRLRYDFVYWVGFRRSTGHGEEERSCAIGRERFHVRALGAENEGKVLRGLDLAIPLARHVDIEVDEWHTNSSEVRGGRRQQKIVIDIAEDEVETAVPAQALRDLDKFLVLLFAFLRPCATVELASRLAV